MNDILVVVKDFNKFYASINKLFQTKTRKVKITFSDRTFIHKLPHWPLLITCSTCALKPGGIQV